MKTLSERIRKTGWKRLPFFAGVAVLAGVFLPGCIFHRHRHADLATAVNPGDQPDKILYEKATNEITHGRYDVGRLTLQTLINTYPDSEYLAKAKLAIADSYYDQGGVSGFTQSESEYKDFITFFPTAPEAPMAQFHVAMAHFQMMAKADRDQTEARLADAEFKEFLLKYPENPLTVRVKARLRETQEVLAEGEFETASFYQFRGAYRAAKGRYREIIEKYPNFSGGDEALYGMGQCLEHLKTPKEAVPYYARLVRDFPLSPREVEAKDRLVAMGAPVPKPTKATMARAEADAARLRTKNLLNKLSTAMSSSPDTSATMRGPVELGGGQASGLEMAKRAPTAPSPANASIIAQPLSNANLNSEREADTNPANDNSNQGAGASTQGDNANSNQGASVNSQGVNANASQGASANPQGDNANASQGASVNPQGANANASQGASVNPQGANANASQGASANPQGVNANASQGASVNPQGDNANSSKAANPNPQDSNANSSSSGSSPKTVESNLNSSGNQSTSKGGATPANAAPQDQSGTTTPAKKKGRFHILKKVIKPF